MCVCVCVRTPLVVYTNTQTALFILPADLEVRRWTAAEKQSMLLIFQGVAVIQSLAKAPPVGQPLSPQALQGLHHYHSTLRKG